MVPLAWFPSVAYSARTGPSFNPNPFDVPLPARLKNSVGFPFTELDDPKSVHRS